MDLNQFTTKSQEIISQAQQLTITFGHQAIENSHILSSIISIDKNVFPYITKKIGGNIEIIKKANESIIESYPKVSGGNIHLSNLNACGCCHEHMRQRAYRECRYESSCLCRCSELYEEVCMLVNSSN